jgi:hypothetical protein
MRHLLNNLEEWSGLLSNMPSISLSQTAYPNSLINLYKKYLINHLVYLVTKNQQNSELPTFTKGTQPTFLSLAPDE